MAGLDRKTEGWISDVVGALSDPVLCMPPQLDRPPEFMDQAITLMRLIENMVAMRENRDPMATDAETAWYLSSASLDSMLSDQWCRIYMYCFTKTFDFLKKEVPRDLRQDELDHYDMGFLVDLKRWIYKERANRRKSLDRQARVEARATKKEEAEAAQPAMFEL